MHPNQKPNPLSQSEEAFKPASAKLTYLVYPEAAFLEIAFP